MYLDTSVLAKLFIREPDSERCIDQVADSFIVSSELAHAEMVSALLWKERIGSISTAQREWIWADFETKVQNGSIQLIALTGLVVRQAAALMSAIHLRVPLRTLDSIHLATYRSALAGPLFTTDRRMREAATLLEIPLVT